MEIHIPSIPSISGRIKTAEICKTNVLRKEISAEISPLFNAVKNDEP